MVLRYGFELRARRPDVALHVSSDLDLSGSRCEELADVAQRTRERTRAWLGAEPVSGSREIDVFLCARPAELRLLEDALALPPSTDPSLRVAHAEGGYYHGQGTVLLFVDPDKDLAWLVSHELVHSVFREVARSRPVALSEGLAEVLPSWILYGGGVERPEDFRALYPDYERVCARLVAQGRVPPLADFVVMPYLRFQDDRWTNFSLAWSLSRLLVESDDPALAGRLPVLARGLGVHPNAWQDFVEVYDPERVEQLWLEALRGPAGQPR